MPFDAPRVKKETGSERPIEGLTTEEVELMEKTWFHGSGKRGIKKLRPAGAFRKMMTGRPAFFFKEVIYVDFEPYTAEIYGKHISEWKLTRPLMIVSGDSITKRRESVREAKRRGYAGIYFQAGAGGTHPHGIVFDGRDLEKTGEKTVKQREKERIEELRVQMQEQRIEKI